MLNKFIYLLFFCAYSFLTSCGAPHYIQKPDYDNPRYRYSNIKQNDIEITEVKDNRNKNKLHPQSLGIARKRLFNLPAFYEFDEPLEDFVKKSLVAILENDSVKNIDKSKVSVSIDEFALSAEQNLFTQKALSNIVLTFTYDSSGINKNIKTSFADSFNSTYEISSRLQYLSYDGIYECARQFAEEYTKDRILAEKTANPDSPFLASMKENEVNIFENENLLDYKRMYILEFGLGYNMGNYSKNAVSLFVKYYFTSNSASFMHGYGYNWEIGVMKSLSSRDLYTNTFSIMYSPLYFFSRNQKGFFLTGDIGANYTISNYPFSNYAFSSYNINWGASFKECLGYKIGPLAIKAGLYQQLWIISDVLPNDLGALLALSIMLN